LKKYLFFNILFSLFFRLKLGKYGFNTSTLLVQAPALPIYILELFKDFIKLLKT